jgi:uncharacterized membrane protein YpjA
MIKTYPNTSLFLLLLGVGILGEAYGFFHALARLAGELRVGGIFVSGMFTASLFTAPAGFFMLYEMTDMFSLLSLSIFGGLGAMVSDYYILRFLKHGLWAEWRLLAGKYFKLEMGKIFKIRAIRWLMPIIGAIFIILPLPDEIGIGLMGIGNMPKYRFLFLVFCLNTLGIYVLLSGALLVVK